MTISFVQNYFLRNFFLKNFNNWCRAKLIFWKKYIGQFSKLKIIIFGQKYSLNNYAAPTTVLFQVQHDKISGKEYLLDICAAPRTVIIGAKIKFSLFYIECHIILYINIFGQTYSLPLTTVIVREKINVHHFIQNLI